ncbi:MAG: hypothetical protein V1909_06745 [Candidatus Micrarchaeota archaeon]
MTADIRFKTAGIVQKHPNHRYTGPNKGDLVVKTPGPLSTAQLMTDKLARKYSDKQLVPGTSIVEVVVRGDSRIELPVETIIFNEDGIGRYNSSKPVDVGNVTFNLDSLVILNGGVDSISVKTVGGGENENGKSEGSIR